MNMPHEIILARLKKDGHRLTRGRRAITEIVAKASKPLTAMKIREELVKRKEPLNKTTIYRELAFLAQTGMLQEISFREGVKRYEPFSSHHHHLVCLKCEDTQDIPLTNELATIEQQIERTTDFHLTAHTLEFFGLCAACR